MLDLSRRVVGEPVRANLRIRERRTANAREEPNEVSRTAVRAGLGLGDRRSADCRDQRWEVRLAVRAWQQFCQLKPR